MLVLEVLFYLLVVAGCLAAIGSFVVLVFLARIIMRLGDQQREFFGDVVEVMEEFEPVAPAPPPEPQEKKSKTWDEKYEEEIAEAERRRRRESGLLDLGPPRNMSNYGMNPMSIPANQDGLVVQDRGDNNK